VIGAALLAACASPSADISAIPELPAVGTADITTLLGASTEPVVLNVWASWCIPCRSEAPLLSRAAVAFADRVRFVGLNVRDDQTGAREFIAEFLAGAGIEHVFDAAGNVPVDLGGSRAVPLTFFYAPGGVLATLHTGVLDERTLALQIDELLARS
jgi:cytochrome c biogenesis protein CcmG/thiol:disulfide interchange protein DsbE